MSIIEGSQSHYLHNFDEVGAKRLIRLNEIFSTMDRDVRPRCHFFLILKPRPDLLAVDKIMHLEQFMPTYLL